MLDKLLEGKSWLVNDTLSVCDLQLYVLLAWIGTGTLDGITKECITKFPNLVKLVTALDEMPSVKAWNEANNKKLPWL